MAARRDDSGDDATYQLLARLFWRASTPLVSSLLLYACAGGDGSAELVGAADALGGKSLHCAEQRWRPMSALKLAQPVDFIGLRRGAGRGFVEIDAAGRPCAKASDPRICEAELLRATAQAKGTGGSHLVYTQGDTVRALQTLDEKLSLLGAIDTPDEALVVLEHNGLPVQCGAAPGFDMTQVRVRDGGYRIATHAAFGACGKDFTRKIVDVDPAGAMQLVSESGVTLGPCPPPTGVTAGRRPPNLLAPRPRTVGACALARYFARVARLEAASVPAFEQLAEELRVLGAPRALRRAALRAAEDEVRHARDTGALAEHFGARPEPLRLSRRRLRGRAEVALDNALEGCVHETYAAYLATAQARLAQGALLRDPLRRIAQDETQHAALAWQIAAWIEPQLAPGTRRYVASQRTRALHALGG